MEGLGLDRIKRLLAESSARRQALLGSIGGMFAAAASSFSLDAEAKNKKKKKKRRKKRRKKKKNQQQCKNRNESCSSNAECCESTTSVVCRNHLATQQDCAVRFPGPRCCGLGAAVCNPGNGNCDCCDDLVCDLAIDDQFRCQPAEP